MVIIKYLTASTPFHVQNVLVHYDLEHLMQEMTH